MYTPNQILQNTVNYGIIKVNKPLREKALLGFSAGAFVAFGAMTYLKVTGLFTGDLAPLGSLAGAVLFNVGLVGVLIAGGELATGNMMAVGTALVARKVSFTDYLKNVATILFFNLLGAALVAFLFGYFLNIVEADIAIATARSKIDVPFMEAFISGIGCNWLVGLSVWLSYGSESAEGKIQSFIIPITVFVLLGFQHSVANFYYISQAIAFGGASWLELLTNAVPVILGNMVGAFLFISCVYTFALKPAEKLEDEQV